MNFFAQIGGFVMMLRQAFTRPEKWGVLWRNFIEEIYKIGISSMSLVAILSIFMGAVMIIQTDANIDSPWIPKYTIGFTVRQSIILEFSSTMLCLILAGKVGSNIASEVGTMRLTEQIDALEVMGINSVNHLILPKILAAMFIIPFLVVLSMGLGLVGGGFIGIQTDIVTFSELTYGLQYWFVPFHITYSLIKAVFFAFFLSAVPSFYGYHVRPSGGALEVGSAGTKSVVVSSVMVLLVNLLVTYFLLL